MARSPSLSPSELCWDKVELGSDLLNPVWIKWDDLKPFLRQEIGIAKKK